MPHSLQLRRARRSDAAEIVRFNQAMAWETEKKQLEDDVIAAGVGYILEHPGAGFYIIAEKEGRTAASLMVTYEWSDWRNGFFWWIQSVYVLPEYRRQGLYSRMYDYVKQLAGTQGGSCGFRLYVETDNETAQKTYEALGMKQCRYLMYEEAAAPRQR